jgi:hypothetical protein
MLRTKRRSIKNSFAISKLHYIITIIIYLKKVSYRSKGMTINVITMNGAPTGTEKVSNPIIKAQLTELWNTQVFYATQHNIYSYVDFDWFAQTPGLIRMISSSSLGECFGRELCPIVDGHKWSRGICFEFKFGKVYLYTPNMENPNSSRPALMLAEASVPEPVLFYIFKVYKTCTDGALRQALRQKQLIAMRNQLRKDLKDQGFDI